MTTPLGIPPSLAPGTGAAARRAVPLVREE